MKIVVDSDACPVKNIIVEEARKRGIEVIMVCDTSHITVSYTHLDVYKRQI